MKPDLRGANFSPRCCAICGKTYQPKVNIQETCGGDCAQKNKNMKRTAKGVRKVGYDNRRRFDVNGAVIVASPDEYADYIGLEYGSVELEASLHIGLLPPGVTFERKGKRYKVIGEPTPIDFALSGLGHYNHQKLEVIK